jgi:quercetin dioxygenase-like cupin family protein
MTFPVRITQLPRFDGPFDAHKLTAPGCDVLFASYPEGTAIGAHSHETHNVGVITAGRLRLTVDGRETAFGPGDWYEVRAGVIHLARFDVATSEIEFWFHTDVSR